MVEMVLEWDTGHESIRDRCGGPYATEDEAQTNADNLRATYGGRFEVIAEDCEMCALIGDQSGPPHKPVRSGHRPHCACERCF